jgi:hypothetical protein
MVDWQPGNPRGTTSVGALSPSERLQCWVDHVDLPRATSIGLLTEQPHV